MNGVDLLNELAISRMEFFYFSSSFRDKNYIKNKQISTAIFDVGNLFQHKMILQIIKGTSISKVITHALQFNCIPMLRH